MTLRFQLSDKYATGKWSCIDGYSNYSVPRYDLADHYPNAVDSMQDCNIASSIVSQTVLNNRIYLKVQFNRLFVSSDTSRNDVNLFPGQNITLQTRVEAVLSPQG
mmetsp:Transcript_17688/g.29902  ORF Transcript_17688/g.29902 Transcript_17688/m.29902 type:complete len:105 (-) Transcript_17688:259-573(-)